MYKIYNFYQFQSCNNSLVKYYFKQKELYLLALICKFANKIFAYSKPPIVNMDTNNTLVIMFNS